MCKVELNRWTLGFRPFSNFSLYFLLSFCIYSQTWAIRIARDRLKHSYNSDFIGGDFAGTGQKIRLIQDFVQL